MPSAIARAGRDEPASIAGGNMAAIARSMFKDGGLFRGVGRISRSLSLSQQVFQLPQMSAAEYTQFIQRRTIELSQQYPNAAMPLLARQAGTEWTRQRGPPPMPLSQVPPAPPGPTPNPMSEQLGEVTFALLLMAEASRGVGPPSDYYGDRLSDLVGEAPAAVLVAAIQLGNLTLVQRVVPQLRLESLGRGLHPIVLALAYNQPAIFNAVKHLPMAAAVYEDLFKWLIVRDALQYLPEFYERYVTVEPRLDIRYETIGAAMDMALEMGWPQALPAFDPFVLTPDFERIIRSDYGETLANYIVRRHQQLLASAPSAAGTAIRRPASPSSPASPPRQYARLD